MNPALQDSGILGLDTLLAVAAMFLGLALIVQVIQELYKYLFSTKAKVYRMVLKDFFGPWVDQLYEAGPAARFQVRGPFQFFRSQPTGVLLPLTKEELFEAMDTLAPKWMGNTLEALKNEKRLQDAGPAPPSPNLEALVADLQAAAEVEPRHSNAGRMLDFLKEWKLLDEGGKLAGEVDAARLLEGLYQRFFPDRTQAEQELGQLERNYDHAYKRRNLRYSFLFGLLVAVFLNFPFDAIYERASTLGPEEAAALATAILDVEGEIGELPPLPETSPAAGAGEPGGAGSGADTSDGDDDGDAVEARRELLAKLEVLLDPERKGAEEPLYSRGYHRMRAVLSEDGPKGLVSYLLNCLVTALLVSFGAPFWHRLSEALLNIRRGQQQEPTPTTKEA